MTIVEMQSKLSSFKASFFSSLLRLKNQQNPQPRDSLTSQEQEKQKNLQWLKQLCGNLLVLVLYSIIGCVFYCTYERWTIKGTLFFTVVTISTVGK